MGPADPGVVADSEPIHEYIGATNTARSRAVPRAVALAEESGVSSEPIPR